ncbi:MAG: tetratricopeptide repeat protein [Archaeoglobaceae archaeon]
MNTIEKIEELILEEKFFEAFQLLLSEAPEEVKPIIEKSISNVEILKNLEGLWKNLALLIHFTYSSTLLSRESDSQSLVSCIVASVNAIKIARELKMMKIAPKMMRIAGKALNMMKMNDRAERMLTEAEKICLELDYKEELLRVYNDLSSLYYELGRYSEAREKIDSAIKLAGDRKDSDAVMSFSIAAEIYAKIGEFKKAEEFYQTAEKMLREIVKVEKSSKFELGILLSNYGIFCKRMGRYEMAEKMLLESLEIFKELEKLDYAFSQFVATNLRHLGDLYREMKRFEDAERFYSMSREKFREIQRSWESFGG